MATELDTNKSIVRDYLRAFNDGDREALSGLLADDVVEHGVHETVRGVDEILGVLDAHFSPFPDYSGTTDAITAEDDLVTVRYTASGTHTGEFRGVEGTGHRVEWSGIAMYRIENDKIAEIWIEEDRLGLLEQLEVVDPPAHLRI